MSINKRIIAILLGVVLSIGCFAGCSNTGKSKQESLSTLNPNHYFSDLTDVYDYVSRTYGDEALNTTYISEVLDTYGYYIIAKVVYDDDIEYCIFPYTQLGKDYNSPYGDGESYGYYVIDVYRRGEVETIEADLAMAGVTIRHMGYEEQITEAEGRISVDKNGNLIGIHDFDFSDQSDDFPYLRTDYYDIRLEYDDDGRVIFCSDYGGLNYTYTYQYDGDNLSEVLVETTVESDVESEPEQEATVVIEYDDGIQSGAVFTNKYGDEVEHHFMYDDEGRIEGVSIQTFGSQIQEYHYKYEGKYTKRLYEIVYESEQERTIRAVDTETGNTQMRTIYDANTGDFIRQESYQWEFDVEGNATKVVYTMEDEVGGMPFVVETTTYDSQGRPLVRESVYRDYETVYLQYTAYNDEEERADGISNTGSYSSTPYLTRPYYQYF